MMSTNDLLNEKAKSRFSYTSLYHHNVVSIHTAAYLLNHNTVLRTEIGDIENNHLSKSHTDENN